MPNHPALSCFKKQTQILMPDRQFSLVHSDFVTPSAAGCKMGAGFINKPADFSNGSSPVPGKPEPVRIDQLCFQEY